DGAQDAARGGGFAAAALADQCQGLALGDREADVIDGADVPDRLLKETAPDREELLKVLDLEQRLTLLDRAIGAVAARGAVGSWHGRAHRPAAAGPPPYRKHAASWCSPTWINSGSCASHVPGMKSGQRG